MMDKNPAILYTAIFLFFFIIFFCSLSGHFLSIDEILMAETAKSILRSHTFALSPNMNGIMNSAVGKDGNYYSQYPLGMSFLAVPFIAFGNLLSKLFPYRGDVISDFVCLSLNPLITALNCLLIFIICTRFKIKPRTAFFTSLCYAIATPAWYYSKGFTSQPLEALAILFTIFLLARFSEDLQRKKTGIFLAGLASGIMVFSRYAAAIYLPVIALYIFLLFDKNKAKNMLLYISPVSAAIILIGIFDYARFGNIFETGYEESWFNKPFIEGLRLYLFDINRSIFLYMPISVLGIIGFYGFWRNYKKEASLIFSLILANIFIYSKWISDGGWCWGPRFLLPLITLLMIPFAFFLNNIKKRQVLKLSLVFIIVLSSFAINLLGVLVNPNQYYDFTAQVSEPDNKNLPGQIRASYYFLIHKMKLNEEIYMLSDFNISSGKSIDLRPQLHFHGLSLWFMLLKEIKGSNAGFYIVTILLLLAVCLFIFILRRVNIILCPEKKKY